MEDGKDGGNPLEPPAPVELTPPADTGATHGAGRRRRTGVGIAAVALIAVIAIVVVLVATRDDRADQHVTHRVVTGPAGRALYAALGATTAAGSYTATFDFQSTPSPNAPKPRTVPCPEVHRGSGTVIIAPDGITSATTFESGSGTSGCTMVEVPRQAVSITGHATVNTDPYRMVAESQVTGFGAITVHVDSTRLWETGGGNYGLDGSNDGPGSPLSGFASLVEGTLGAGQGALTMITLASPNGYLHLEKEAVSGVTPAGTGVVDGTPVTFYEVDVDPAKLLDIPGLSGEQIKTIHAGLDGLKQVDYKSTRVKVAIDDAGFIRQTSSVATFADGSRMTSTTTLSNFGCAGIVRLPGDPPAPTTPTVPCVSPDTGTTTTSTSTTSTSTSTTTTTTTLHSVTQSGDTTATTTAATTTSTSTTTTP